MIGVITVTVILNNAKIKTLLPSATDDQIGLYEGIFDDAEQCLANYSQNTQELVTSLAVAHMIEFTETGAITSESTRQGASASYAFVGKGLEGTRYGSQLASIPAGQCIIGIFSQPLRFARGITPCR